MYELTTKKIGSCKFQVFDPRSTSRPDRLYNVMCTRDMNVFSCDCFAFHNALRLDKDNKDCKHIIKVRKDVLDSKFNIKRKIFIYDLEKAKTKITPYDGKIECPKCGSTDIRKGGRYKTNMGIRQRQICKMCDKYFVPKTQYSNSRFSTIIVDRAIDMINSGIPIRRIPSKLYSEFDMKISADTIYCWKSKYAHRITFKKAPKKESNKHRWEYVRTEALRLYGSGMTARDVQKHLAKKGYKMAYRTIWSWRKKFNETERNSVKKVSPSSAQQERSRRYLLIDENTVRKVLKMLNEGFSIKEIQKNMLDDVGLKLHYSTIWSWKNKFSKPF